MKKFIITEEEKSRIRNLYITEQKSDENPLDIFLNAAAEELKKAGLEPEEKEEEEIVTSDDDTETPTGSSSDFIDITKKVIKNFEGGYWNPECAQVKGSGHPKKEGIMLNSGETMFGLDREAGNIENLSPEGKQFFKIIDDEKEKMGLDSFCKKWRWNYLGGELKEKLMDLAAKVMQKQYEKYASSYLKGDAKNVVESSRPLMLHFSYATWNGPGFFKDFANSINKGVAEKKSVKDLIKIAKNDRDRRFGGGSWAKANEKVKAAIDAETNNLV